MRLIRLLAFTAFVIGCSEPTAPVAFSGTFSLRSINQAPLPSIQGTFNGAPIVFADTMAFADSVPIPGAIVFTRSWLLQYPNRGVEQLRAQYEASVSGDTLVINDCPLNVTCSAIALAPLRGVLRGDTLRLLARPLSGGVQHEQLFVRAR
jgi:hypothetical protein